jgi:hypothetical protein
MVLHSVKILERWRIGSGVQAGAEGISAKRIIVVWRRVQCRMLKILNRHALSSALRSARSWLAAGLPGIELESCNALPAAR